MNRKVVSEDVLFCLFARFVLRTLNISFCGLQRISQPEELWNDGDTQSKKRCSVSYSSSG